MKIKDIKIKIKEILDELVIEEVLSASYKQHWEIDMLRDIQSKKMPCAILTNNAQITSEADTNRSIIRTYSLGIQLCFKTDLKSDPDLVDELVEKVMDKFDNKVTLSGEGETSLTWIEPSVSSPYKIDGLKSIVFVDLILKVKREVELVFGDS